MRLIEISLSDLRFHSKIGVLPQEQIVGNEFIVDSSVRIPYSERMENDDLDVSISYADIYSIIEEEMEKPRKLLEACCVSIANRLKEKWGMIESGSITICKSTPPISGITGSAKVTLFF